MTARQILEHTADVVDQRRQAYGPPDAIMTNGAGNHTGFLNRYFRFRQHGTQLAPTSGSMGYGLPAAIAWNRPSHFRTSARPGWLAPHARAQFLARLGRVVEHRVDHLLRLRQLQDDTRGFQCFIPLAFHNENNSLRKLPEPTAVDSLRTLAVSRLLLDNIPHIKAYWIMLGIGTAQIALSYGADDIDGTVRHELIYHDAGATTPEIMSVAELERVIREAGREPIERDTLYHRIERSADSWRAAEPIVAGV